MSPSATSTWLLNLSEDGDSAISLSSRFPSLISFFYKKYFLGIRTKCPVVQLEVISSAHILGFRGEYNDPDLCLHLSRDLWRTIRLPQSCFPSVLNTPPHSALLHHTCAPDHSQMPFPLCAHTQVHPGHSCCAETKRNAGLEEQPHRCPVGEDNHCSAPAGLIGSDRSWDATGFLPISSPSSPSLLHCVRWENPKGRTQHFAFFCLLPVDLTHVLHLAKSLSRSFLSSGRATLLPY